MSYSYRLDKVVIQNWREYYAVLPTKDINGKWHWLKPMFYRKVWLIGAFGIEPEIEYGTIFDVIKGD